MENSKRAERIKQEDTALNHALLWFAAAVVLEFLLLLVNKYYVNFLSTKEAIALAQALGPVLKVISVVAVAASVFGGVWCWKRVKTTGTLPFLPMLVSVTVLVIGVGAALVVAFRGAAVELLYVLVPAGAVLALVYYLYQKEFFLSACAVGVGLLGLWLVRKNNGNHNLMVAVYVIAAAAVLLGAMLLLLRLQKGNGVLSVKEKQYRVLPKRSNFLMMILSVQFSLLTMIAGLLLGGTAAFYLLFVLMAWLFVLLVYYTVKLM